jgi:hypothetical protein
MTRIQLFERLLELSRRRSRHDHDRNRDEIMEEFDRLTAEVASETRWADEYHQHAEEMVVECKRLTELIRRHEPDEIPPMEKRCEYHTIEILVEIRPDLFSVGYYCTKTNGWYLDIDEIMWSCIVGWYYLPESEPK